MERRRGDIGNGQRGEYAAVNSPCVHTSQVILGRLRRPLSLDFARQVPDFAALSPGARRPPYRDILARELDAYAVLAKASPFREAVPETSARGADSLIQLGTGSSPHPCARIQQLVRCGRVVLKTYDDLAPGSRPMEPRSSKGGRTPHPRLSWPLDSPSESGTQWKQSGISEMNPELVLRQIPEYLKQSGISNSGICETVLTVSFYPEYLGSSGMF
jgi:hypothetical protein